MSDVQKKILESDENNINNAAIEEYKTMMNGEKLISTITEWREYRLFLLIKNVKKEEILNDKNVSRIFQISESSARNLLRNVMIKYGSDKDIAGLKEEIKKQVVNRIEKNKSTKMFEFECQSQIVIDWLNEMLEDKPGLEKVMRKPKTVSKYWMIEDTYDEISEKINNKG